MQSDTGNCQDVCWSQYEIAIIKKDGRRYYAYTH